MHRRTVVAAHRRTVVAAVSSLFALAVVTSTAGVAGADPVNAGEAYAFGTTLSVGGSEVVPPTLESSMTLPPGGEDSDTAIDVPADPLAVSGTLTTDATVHAESDVASALEVDSQALAGPYNATAVSTVEELNVLLDQPQAGVSVVEADLIRAEAVGVCIGDQVQYDATTEVLNLVIGGSDVPLNGPLEDLLTAIDEQLEPLADLVDVEFNVVTPLPDGGVSVDALVITLLAAAGEDPLAELVIGHAEVSGLTCAGPQITTPPADIPPVTDPPPDRPDLARTGGPGSTGVGLAAGLGLAAVAGWAVRRRLFT